MSNKTDKIRERLHQLKDRANNAKPAEFNPTVSRRDIVNEDHADLIYALEAVVGECDVPDCRCEFTEGRCKKCLLDIIAQELHVEEG